jgi:hypothetical protein
VSGQIDKALRPLVRIARKAGFEVVNPPGRSGHFRLVAPDGDWHGLASSGGGGVGDLRAFLRRHGCDPPG